MPVQCPHCGAWFQIPEGQYVPAVQCFQCRNVVAIAPPPPPSTDWPPAPPAEAAWQAPASSEPAPLEGWRPDNSESVTARLRAASPRPERKVLALLRKLIPPPLARTPWWAQLLAILLTPIVLVLLVRVIFGTDGAIYTIIAMDVGVSVVGMMLGVYLGFCGGWGARFAQWESMGCWFRGDKAGVARARAKMMTNLITLLFALPLIFVPIPAMIVGIAAIEFLDPGFMKRPIGGGRVTHLLPTSDPLAEEGRAMLEGLVRSKPEYQGAVTVMIQTDGAGKVSSVEADDYQEEFRKLLMGRTAKYKAQNRQFSYPVTRR